MGIFANENPLMPPALGHSDEGVKKLSALPQNQATESIR